MIRFLRFFYRGPGAILLLVGAVIGIGSIIHQGQEKRKIEDEKKADTRPLGKVNPTSSVDQSHAQAAQELEKRELFPVNKDKSPVPVQYASNQTISQRAPLPQMVSFYTQVAATPTPAPPEREHREEPWLPASSFIPCALVNTIESSHINTPVVGEVIRDCWSNGKLIVPAGTIVSSFAQAGATRDRIEVAGSWLFVFPDGRQLKANGIACDREADPSNQQFGVEDGSAGLQGSLIESDHWANAKAFIALLMTATAQAGTAAANGLVNRGGYSGVQLPDTTPIMAKYLDQLLNGETGDGRFVRVPAAKEFYIFPTDTLLPTHRQSVVNGSNGDKPLPKTDLDAAIQMEREIYRNSQHEKTTDEERPKFKY